MMFEVVLIGSVVAVACAIPGVFLVLRRMALMSDAISHAVLPGIVGGFFLAKIFVSSGEHGHSALDSPLLIIGAVVMSMVTVTLTELLYKTKLVKSDAAIGMVFPALFSIGVIIVSKYAANVHLDTDAVLLGEIALAPLDRVTVLGLSIPKSLLTMSIIMVLNLVLVLIFLKEIKIATFDPGLAASFGYRPTLLHYGLMLMVSITAVGAFDSVGSILVVALMIAPAAAAYLLTDRVSLMILLAALIGIFSAVLGYGMAISLDASIAGAMATSAGILFMCALIFAPHRGLLSLQTIKKKRKWDFAQKMLTVHLLHHEGTEAAANECRSSHLTDHINWSESFAKAVVDKACSNGLVLCSNDELVLTDKGRAEANSVMTR